ARVICRSASAPSQQACEPVQDRCSGPCSRPRHAAAWRSRNRAPTGWVAWATNAITGSLQETVRKLIGQDSGRSWKVDLHSPSSWFERFDPNLPGVDWKQRPHAVGPLDQANPSGAPVIGHAKVLELPGRLQAKDVEVINRNPSFVLMDQNKSRTGDRARIDSQRLGYGPDQPGLAGAQGTDQADHATGIADIG